MSQRLRSLLIAPLIAATLAAAMTGSSPSALALSGGVPSCGARATPADAPEATLQSASATPTVPTKLHPVADIPLSGNADRFDYQSFDAGSGRLYISHMASGQLIVFDVASKTIIKTIDGMPGVTGVLAVPDLGRIYASVTGAHEVVAIDATSLKIVAHIGSIDFPDGLDYSPETHQIYVTDEHRGGELVIDAKQNSVVTTINVGESGNTHYDAKSGCVIVAAQGADQLAIIDPRSNDITARMDLGGGCKGPHGFLIDETTHRAYISCEENAALLTVDLTTGSILNTTRVGATPDVLAYDPGFHWLYVASESGTVNVFDTAAGTPRAVMQFHTPHAHSVAVDPQTHLVYFPLENSNGKPVLRVMAPT